MVAAILSGLIVVMFDDVVYPTFWITLMVFVKVLQRDSCYGL